MALRLLWFLSLYALLCTSLSAQESQGPLSPLNEKIHSINCTNKVNIKASLTNGFGQELPDLMPRDLEGTEWCYAYAAADLLSFKTEVKVSAAHIALNYNMHGNDPYSHPPTEYTDPMLYKNYLKKKWGMSREIFAKDGILKEAIDLLSEVCREKDLPSDLFLETPVGKKILAIQEDNQDCQLPSAKKEESLELLVSEIKSIIGNIILSPEELKTLEVNTLVEDEISRTCSDKVSLKGIKTRFVKLDNQKNSRNFFDKILDSGNIFAIRFNDHYIRRKIPGVSLDLSLNNTRHFSTVIGRRWNEKNNRCEYLIRNIWGDDCKWFNPINDCIKGHIWLDEENLSKSTADAIFLED